MTKSYYATLQIKQNATASEIQQAYRRLAPRYHPDVIEQRINAKVNSGAITKEEGERRKHEAADKWNDINKAYNILKNPDSKERYDSMLNQLLPPEELAQMREQLKMQRELNKLKKKNKPIKRKASVVTKIKSNKPPVMKSYNDMAQLFDWYYSHA